MTPLVEYAEVKSESPGQTVWRVRTGTTVSTARSYYATTYPNSELIFIETVAKRRPVSKHVASKLEPLIRALIEKAKKS